MQFSQYDLKARIMPSILTIVLPILIFNHFYASEEFSKLVGDIIEVKIVSDITVGIISLIFLSQIGRVIGKNLFEKLYFSNELEMPTTNYLMYTDKTYSEEYKNDIRKKIMDDFNVSMPTLNDENADEANARTRIVETMALVRSMTHSNKFLLQHNIEYGAMRNAIGGSVLGAMLSLVNILFFYYFSPIDFAVIASAILLVIYSLFIVFSKVIIVFYGNNYAKILFREYLSTST